jgi:hypothetical protein
MSCPACTNPAIVFTLRAVILKQRKKKFWHTFTNVLSVFRIIYFICFVCFCALAVVLDWLRVLTAIVSDLVQFCSVLERIFFLHDEHHCLISDYISMLYYRDCKVS